MTASLVDDAKGQDRDSHPLALPPDYNPARLWVTVRRRHVDSQVEQQTYPYYSVTASDGTVLQDGIVGNGSKSIHDNVTTGPDLPLLLEPGSYSLSAWIGGRTPDTAATRLGECNTSDDLAPGDDVMLQAVFDRQDPCAWSNEAQPTFGTL